MNPTSPLLAALLGAGVDYVTGVPCSLLAPTFAALEAGGHRITYVPAPREDTALGLAAGAYLAGRRPVVLMQNSGLGYGLNVITSLHLIYGIPLPLVITWRGYRDDAVEHDVIGPALPALLDVIGIPYRRMVDASYDTEWLLAETTKLSGPAALLITEPS